MKTNSFIFYSLLFLLVSINTYSQVYESRQSGNWIHATTWVYGNIPPANTEGITIRIQPDHTVTFQGNGANFRYGQNVVFDIQGSLIINGWSGFQVGNNAQYLISGSFRNGQNFTTGQNSSFEIWGELTVASVFQSGNNSEFFIHQDATFRNSASFTSGNNTKLDIQGDLINQGHRFVVGNNSSVEIGEDGFFHNASTFVAGNNLQIIVDGLLFNNGYTFNAGDNTEIFINEDGNIITNTTMSFGDELFLFIEGALSIAGYNFSFGDDAQIFLLGEMEIGNHYVFKAPNNQTTYFYVCNGGDLPSNLPENSLIVEADCSVLPVELLYLEANASHTNVELKWATASETNSDYFQVERSSDGYSWESITWIQSAGNSNELLKYQYTDENLSSGVWYYRLKQVDFDGASEYFAPVAVRVDAMQEFTIASLRKSGQNVMISANFEAGGQLKVYNTMGHVLATEKFSSDTHTTSFFFAEQQGAIVIAYVNPQTGIFFSSTFFVR